MRKTIEVETIRKAVNTANESLATAFGPDQRMGHNALLELVLHRTGNYKGFGYVPGWGPFDGPAEDGVPNKAHDDTRRVYY